MRMDERAYEGVEWDALDNLLTSFPALRCVDLVFEETTTMKGFLEAGDPELKLPNFCEREGRRLTCRHHNWRNPSHKGKWYRQEQ